MTKTKCKLLLLTLTLLTFLFGVRLFAQEALPGQYPDSVAGKWIISARNWDGVVDTKFINLRQAGNLVTGHFKGPNQSGSLDGTINIHHIDFRTNTRTPLTFRGRVDGSTIQGTYNVRGRRGVFTAYRQEP